MSKDQLSWNILNVKLYFCKRNLCSLGGLGLFVSLEYFPNGEINLHEGRSWLYSSRKYLPLFDFCIEFTEHGSYIGSLDVISSIEGNLKMSPLGIKIKQEVFLSFFCNDERIDPIGRLIYYFKNIFCSLSSKVFSSLSQNAFGVHCIQENIFPF